MAIQPQQIQAGTDVYGRDGEKIGSVAGIADRYFIIEKGFLFKTDLYVPVSTVTSANDDRVTLALSKDEIENEDWSSEPTVPVTREDFDIDADAGVTRRDR